MNKHNLNIILIRHGKAVPSGDSNPRLSKLGHEQAESLGEHIKETFGETPFTIWSSPANRAKETAEAISKLNNNAEIVVKDKLWSDNNHRHDYGWFMEEIESYEGIALVIVSHLEYVQIFPSCFGFPTNEASYAEGVHMKEDSCENFPTILV